MLVCKKTLRTKYLSISQDGGVETVEASQTQFSVESTVVQDWHPRSASNADKGRSLEGQWMASMILKYFTVGFQVTKRQDNNLRIENKLL